MYSFYGGKQGRTYNIVERYDEIYIDLTKIDLFSPGTYNIGDRFTFESKIYLVLSQDGEDSSIPLTSTDLNDNTKVAQIKGMVNEFQKGGAYTNANYGLYVIIDTILNLNHKNDDINGIIYRRGFDYTEPVSLYKRPSKNDKATRTFTNGGENLSFSNLYIYHDYDIVLNGDTWDAIDKGFNTDRWVAAWRKYILKPGGGAIYVGQIVGPQGESPEIIGLSWQEFLNKENDAGTEDYYKKIRMEPTPGWDKNYVNPDTGEDEPVYNDDIYVGYCNIRDKDDNITGAYLSFNIPQTVFKISAQSVDPYGVIPRNHHDIASDHTDSLVSIEAKQDWQYEDGYNEDNDPHHEHAVKFWKYENLIHQHSKTGILGSHPFYYNFDIAVPNGIHGQDIDTIKLLTGLDIHYVPTKDTYIIDGKAYYNYLEDEDGRITYVAVESPNIENIRTYYELLIDIKNNPIRDNDEYITYYTKNYNDKLEGDLSNPLGILPYRVIDEIVPILKDRGVFSNWSIIEYSELYGLITYTGFANIGDLYILNVYDEENLEEVVKSFTVVCVKEGEVGTELLFNANFQTIYRELLNQYLDLKILKELLGVQIESEQSLWGFIEINSESPVSSLQINYKAGDSNFSSVRTVDYFTIDDNGNFYVSYSDSPLLFYLSNIGRIKNINFENSQLTFDFGEYQKDFTVKQIEKIDIENYDNIKLTQRWRIKYKGINTPEYTDGSINSILAIDKMGDNIIILYSDPDFRNSIEDDTTKIENIDYYFKEWTDPITGTVYDGENKLLWVNLGSTDGTYHVLGTTTYDKLSVTSSDNTYKNGLEGLHAGWVVAVLDNDKIKFFAYDYKNNTPEGTYTIGPNNVRSNWFLASSITDEAINPEKIMLLSKEGSNGKPLKSDTYLRTDGFWFVVSGGHDNYYGENL